jgi:hypothetical protein
MHGAVTAPHPPGPEQFCNSCYVKLSVDEIAECCCCSWWWWCYDVSDDNNYYHYKYYFIAFKRVLTIICLGQTMFLGYTYTYVHTDASSEHFYRGFNMQTKLRHREVLTWGSWWASGSVKYVFIKLYLLTYSMRQSPSWRANRFTASQEIPCILWKPPPVPILSQINPVHVPHPTSWRSILIM